MADIYCSSVDGSDSDDGSTWALAKATLAAAVTAAGSGGRVWLDSAHAESAGATKTITGASASGLTFIYVFTVVRAGGSTPPIASELVTSPTAQVTTTGAFAVAINSNIFIHGVIFSCGSGAVTTALSVSTSAGGSQYFKQCSLRKLGTSANVSSIALGCVGSQTPGAIILDETTIQLGNTGDSITVKGPFIKWFNTPSAIAGAIFPTVLLKDTGQGCNVLFDGVDLSALGSGKTLIGLLVSGSQITIQRCKLNASAAITVTQTGNGLLGGLRSVQLLNSDSGSLNYRVEKYDPLGIMTTETTIVRTGGASDGATPVAHKVVTSANPLWQAPFELPTIALWNETVGSSITITLEGIWGSGSVPNNDDVWFEAEYLGNASFPTASFANCTKATGLSANAALSAGSGTWGGSTTKFNMAVTITPQMKGYIYLTVKVAKVSTTLYIDPKPVVT